jgi:TatD DNase family protein
MSYPNGQQYIDLHTHSTWNYPHIFSIYNLVIPKELETFRETGQTVSTGLHPWYIDPLWEGFLMSLVREAAGFSNVVAIGECGIDVKIETSYEKQQTIFMEQVSIAEEFNKPLIIHCVRAYQQLLKLLQQKKPKVPWIFHGFNQNEQVAKDLIRNGAYLSVGADLFKENSKIRKSLPGISIDHLFFETDNWQQPVWKIYAEAARMLSVPEKELKLQVFENYKVCFPVKSKNTADI